MANINIKNGKVEVENGANQVHGQPWTVTVPVNNREMFRTRQENSCSIPVGDTDVYGHKADVSVKVFDGGNTVAESSKQVCAPIEFQPADDPHPTFGPFDPEPGQYTVRAKVDPVGGGQSDTVERTVHVSETSDAPPADDGGADDTNGSDLWPGGDDDDDGNSDPMGKLDKAMLIVALLAVAWILSSASNTAEAFT